MPPSPQFIGNPDYRGFLNYQATRAGNTAAKQLLGLVGNDAKFGAPNANMGLRIANDQLYKAFQTSGIGAGPIGDPLADIRKALAGLGGGGAPKVYAPKLDFGAVSAQARSAAEGAVNPLYVKYLNNYLAEAAAKRQQKIKETDLARENIEASLSEALTGNEISRVRTGEDVATNLEEIARTADDFQIDSGTALEDTRAALGSELGASGLSGGLANQKVSRTVADQNTQEGRQEQKFTQAREQQQLFKTRSLDDLLRSDTLATGAAERGKKQVQFDLDSYMENLGLEEKSTRDRLEGERQGAIAQNQQQQQSLLVRAFVDSIKNPAQREAALAAYGGMI